jgi:hypothetical protein
MRVCSSFIIDECSCVSYSGELQIHFVVDIPGQRVMMGQPSLSPTELVPSHPWPRHDPIMKQVVSCWPTRLEARPSHGLVRIGWEWAVQFYQHG